MVIWGRAKKEEKIYSVIETSGITSLTELARLIQSDVHEVAKMLEGMIQSATRFSRPLLQKAYVDIDKGLVVLKRDLKADTSIVGNLKSTTNSVLNRFNKKEEAKLDWKCEYCDSTNNGNSLKCDVCGGTR